MSVPARREPDGPVTRWEVTWAALGDNRAMAWLCLYQFVRSAPWIVLAVKLALRVPW